MIINNICRIFTVFFTLGALMFVVEAAESITIEADSAELLSADNRAVYRGHVHVSFCDIVVQADELTLFFVNDAIDNISATGTPVTVTRSKNNAPLRAIAQSMTYDVADASLALTGDAQLSHGDTIYSGENIIYAERTGVIRAVGNKQTRVRAVLPMNND